MTKLKPVKQLNNRPQSAVKQLNNRPVSAVKQLRNKPSASTDTKRIASAVKSKAAPAKKGGLIKRFFGM